MRATCPKCGTRRIRTSKKIGFKEKFTSLFGFFHMRCKICKTRFGTSMWEGQTWKYARCPKCLRFELSTWSEQYYNPPTLIVFLLRMGATPYRCDTCRCNFASFRACKERLPARGTPNERATPVTATDSDLSTANVHQD